MILSKLKNIIKIFDRYLYFIGIGVIGTGCSMLTVYILTDYFKVWYMYSFCIGTLIGSIVNYIGSKFFVFKKND